MIFRYGPKLFILVLLSLLLSTCSNSSKLNTEKLTIGVLSYGEGTSVVDKYERLQQYLAQKTGSMVDLEPAYNELQAVEQIQRKNWSIVFAPPGLAAIAIGRELYSPIFSLEKVSSLERSVIVVQDNGKIDNLRDLSNQTLALGAVGSAAGYYLPLYDLYGLTLAQVRFAPTPKQVLQWVSEGEVTAGALAEDEYDRFRDNFPNTKFSVIHKSRWIPAGLVLISPNVEPDRLEQIKTIMKEAPSGIIADAGYIPSGQIPNYQEFIKLVEKVKPLEKQLRQTPAVLIIKQESVE